MPFDRSPSLTGYNIGDRVQMVCVRVRHALFLAKLRHATTPSGETLPVSFAGAITALSGTSISLHDGDRDLTCAIGDSSPSTDAFRVGQHARVACAGECPGDDSMPQGSR